ncbi:MAG: hypothetical protein MJ101_06225 [Clostridia bacterium]|nr:hypothetical protein [Clostridia bacterium]
MRKELTAKETVILTVLIVLIIGLVYYQFVLTPINTQIADFDSMSDTEESAIIANSARLAQKKKMENYLAALPDDARSLPEYDNSISLMLELHTILSDATDYSLNFSGIKNEDYIVMRTVGLTFTAESYMSARRIIDDLSSGENVMRISDVTITLGGAGNGTVHVSLLLTYYETMIE